jgi:hypothetical protein
VAPALFGAGLGLCGGPRSSSGGAARGALTSRGVLTRGAARSPDRPDRAGATSPLRDLHTEARRNTSFLVGWPCSLLLPLLR